MRPCIERVMALLLLSSALGCGDSDGADGSAPAPYACQAKALIFSGFQGSCDTQSAGHCREWWGTDTANAQSECAALGGSFDVAAECPKPNRVLVCSVGGSTLKVRHLYYSPTYTQGRAADECAALGGRCVRP